MKEEEALKLVPTVYQQSEILTITDEDTKLAGAELLIALKDCQDAIELALDERTSPFKEKVKALNEAAKPFLDRLKNGIASVQGKLSGYKRKLIEEANAKQAQANREYEASKREANAEAAATNTLPAPVAPPQVIHAPVKTILTGDGGSLTATRVKKWMVPDAKPDEDFSLISRADPRLKDLADEWFLLDTGRMTRHIKSVGKVGEPVPSAQGIIVYEDDTYTRKKGRQT